MDGVVELSSPTEIAEDDSELDPLPDNASEHAEHAKKEKRKRVATDSDAAKREEEDVIDSPSKRPLRAGDVPLTGSEIRALLFEHVTEMKSAWSTFRSSVQDRLDGIEQEQKSSHFEINNLQSRTRVVEKDLIGCRQQTDLNTKHLDELTEEVKNMKVQLAEGKAASSSGVNFPAQIAAAPGGTVDPWGEYLKKRQVHDKPDGGDQKDQRDRGDMLTEDEKKTLVLGGWLQDTKRAVIEEESAVILQMEEVKTLIDVDKLAVYGPRRSVGMLKFVVREGETMNDVKNRMWEFVKLVSRLKVQLASTRTGNECRTLWASFVKTKTARTMSSHVSMVRRVTMGLAADVLASNVSGIAGIVADQQSAYDCDWSLGTIWLGVNKLASSTHRVPKDDEHVLMSGGWVSLTAVARAAGCSTEEAKQAFEKEL